MFNGKKHLSHNKFFCEANILYYEKDNISFSEPKLVLSVERQSCLR